MGVKGVKSPSKVSCTDAGGRKSVLLLAPAEETLDLARRIFGAIDWEIGVAATVAETRAAIRVSPPHLLLADLGHPSGAPGLDCLRTARKRFPALPAIALLARESSPDAVAVPGDGPLSTFGKPLDLGALLRCIALLAKVSRPTAGVATAAPARVLLVDDEPSVLRLLEKTLAREGIGADAADSFEAASALLERKRYETVVSDVHLNDSRTMLGLEVLAVAKRFHPETRVILLTGFGSPAIMDRAHKLGADCYFEKPVSVRVLVDALTGGRP